MKATLLGGAAFSLLTVSPHSARISRCRRSPPPPPPPFTWTSCYGGCTPAAASGKRI